MTPAAIIRQAGTEGVSLALSPAGTIKATGNAEAVKRWLPVLREHKPGIVVALATDPPVFDFSLPADPESDREALEERAGIIAEGCGMDHAKALQEARWQVERERAWRVFLRDAQRILHAPGGARQELVVQYETEAASHYGTSVAASMAASMRAWLAGRPS
jgi:hypothetical protein